MSINYIEGLKNNISGWNVPTKAAVGIINLAAIGSIVLGILTLIAVNGAPSGHLNALTSLGNLGGGISLGLGITFPLITLVCGYCRDEGEIDPVHNELQPGAYVKGDWVSTTKLEFGQEVDEGYVWYGDQFITKDEYNLRVQSWTNLF